jgi:hypothetical protein
MHKNSHIFTITYRNPLNPCQKPKETALIHANSWLQLKNKANLFVLRDAYCENEFEKQSQSTPLG